MENMQGITMWTRALETWLRTAERGSEHTARAYRCAVDDFVNFVDSGDEAEVLGEVGGADVAAWANDMADRGLADATIAARLSALSAFYRFCMTTYTDAAGLPLAQFNPVSVVQRPEVIRYGNSRPLTPEQFVALRDQIDRTTVTGLRDFAIIVMAIYTGRRSAELRNLLVGHIQHTATGHRYLWRGKRGKTRWDDLPTPVWQAIQLYWLKAGRESARANEPVFIAHNGRAVAPHPLSSEFLRLMVKDYAHAADLPDITFHTLRHSAVALRLKGGASVLEVSQLLGHGDLRTTQTYLEAIEGFVDTQWQDVESVLAAAQASMQQQGDSESSDTSTLRPPRGRVGNPHLSRGILA